MVSKYKITNVELTRRIFVCYKVIDNEYQVHHSCAFRNSDLYLYFMILYLEIILFKDFFKIYHLLYRLRQTQIKCLPCLFCSFCFFFKIICIFTLISEVKCYLPNSMLKLYTCTIIS